MIRQNIFSETTAVALRTHPFSETSCIVTWFTAASGRISTVVKGAYRPKSGFLGQHDLFYTCDLVYYDRDSNGLNIAKEYSPLKTRHGIRQSWRSSVLASYAASMICDFPQHDPQSREIYDLLETLLDFINEHDAGLPVLFWFELQMLGALGMAPQLARCCRCSSPFQAGSSAIFSVADGGLSCSRCSPSTRHHSQIQLDTMAVLRNWQAASTPRAAHNTRFSPVQAEEVSSLLKSFIDFHVAFPQESRDIAVKLLRHSNKRITK